MVCEAVLMPYMAQTSVIQPAYVAIMQTEREPHSWPLDSMRVYRRGHVIAEDVSRVGRIRLF